MKLGTNSNHIHKYQSIPCCVTDMLDFLLIIWSKDITFCSLHCLIWLWTVLHGRGTRDTCSQLGQNVSRHCMLPLAGVHPLIVTHHPNLFQFGFSLFYCHLDDWTGTLPSQHHHGHTIRDCAAFPVGRRDDGWDTECETESQETINRWVNIRRSGPTNNLEALMFKTPSNKLTQRRNIRNNGCFISPPALRNKKPDPFSLDLDSED